MNVLISGINGRMGEILKGLIANEDELKVVCGFDKYAKKSDVPVYEKTSMIKEDVDVIIDFSVPVATMEILEYAKEKLVPIVIATTGFSEEENRKILEYSKIIPIFKAANMSYDINLMKRLVRMLAPLLQENDIEITEVHHNKKVDAPSGTAQMLADNIIEELNDGHYCEYNRYDKREKRNPKEIGMNSIRGGNIVGEHVVQFFGENETFEIKHTSYSRNVFAEGAIKAAKFMLNKNPGFYGMDDLVD